MNTCGRTSSSCIEIQHVVWICSTFVRNELHSKKSIHSLHKEDLDCALLHILKTEMIMEVTHVSICFWTQCVEARELFSWSCLRLISQLSSFKRPHCWFLSQSKCVLQVQDSIQLQTEFQWLLHAVKQWLYCSLFYVKTTCNICVF